MLYVHMSIQCLSLTGEPHVSGEAVRLAPPCGPDTATKIVSTFLPSSAFKEYLLRISTVQGLYLTLLLCITEPSTH